MKSLPNYFTPRFFKKPFYFSSYRFNTNINKLSRAKTVRRKFMTIELDFEHCFKLHLIDRDDHLKLLHKRWGL